MLTKKAKLFDSDDERRGFRSKEEGMRVDDEQLSATVEFERIGSAEKKMHGWFVNEEPLSRESDGILGVGIPGKENGEAGSGSEPTEEDAVSQRNESPNILKEANYENGKAKLDFDLNYPITDTIVNANGYKIVNSVITIDSDSEDDDDDDDGGLNGDGESYGGLEEKSSKLYIARSESSFYEEEESRFAAKKISYGKYGKEKAQIYEDDEAKLEIGLGLLPFIPKSRD